jgi:hypothetical protein
MVNSKNRMGLILEKLNSVRVEDKKEVEPKDPNALSKKTQDVIDAIDKKDISSIKSLMGFIHGDSFDAIKAVRDQMISLDGKAAAAKDKNKPTDAFEKEYDELLKRYIPAYVKTEQLLKEYKVTYDANKFVKCENKAYVALISTKKLKFFKAPWEHAQDYMDKNGL